MNVIRYVIGIIGVFLVFMPLVKLGLWFICGVTIFQSYGEKLHNLFPESLFLVFLQIVSGITLMTFLPEKIKKQIGDIFDS